MAVRDILREGDAALSQACAPVAAFGAALASLLDDMAETMRHADGVGLAAPQVGVLLRVVVIDVGEGLIELVNPQIVSQRGEQEAVEGCLSCPGEYGVTKRPARVKVKAQDRRGKRITVNGEGLLATALCHEIDHLDGILFKRHVIRMMDPKELQQ